MSDEMVVNDMPDPAMVRSREAIGHARLAGSPLPVARVQEMIGQVLDVLDVGADDDFFDLGGDSLLGLALLGVIEKSGGPGLTLVDLYDAPTARGLAERLSDATPRRSCVVTLREGAGHPPIFLCHGIGGAVGELSLLANKLQTQQPVYGLQARGLDGSEDPIDSVEGMAAHYVTEVRRLQPHGPYLLVGYSFGGLVAIELARLLSEQSDGQPTVIFIDSYPDQRYWPWPSVAAMITRVARRRLLAVRHTRPADMPAMLQGWRRNLWRILSAQIYPRQKRAAPRNASLPDYVQRVRDGGFAALGHYRPGFYDGSVIFIRAADEQELATDAAGIWRNNLRKLTIHQVPGDHRSILRSDVDGLAAILSTCLRAER